MRQMSGAQIKAQMQGAEKGADFKQLADEMAQAAGEDVYLYDFGNWAVITVGPDADHPKTEPTYVAKAPAKTVRAKDRVYDN